MNPLPPTTIRAPAHTQAGVPRALLMPRQRLLVAAILLALFIWLPRGLALDQFITADEHAWLARSGNFYVALARGDWANTFQRHHPGVTVTWVGLAGYLLTYPRYASEAPGYFGWLTEEIGPFLRSQGQAPMEVLAAGRSVSVLIITLTLLGCFYFAVRLLGGWTAFFGLGLIAFAPFHIAHSRLLHLDGLVSSLMLLAVLAWLDFLASRRRNSLLVATLAAGLAWLTRSPALFLVPLVGLLTLPLLVRTWRTSSRAGWLLVGSGLAWGLGGLALFVLLWPAMWVDPVGSLRQVLTAAGDYAAEGHLKPTFFNGAIYSGDPGFWFYPVTYLWRTTPVTLIGLGLATIGVVLRQPPLNTPKQRWVLAALLFYAVSFMLFMNIGAKKFDRYALPAYLPLELIAGAGWAWALGWAGRRGVARGTVRFWPLAAGSVLAAQALTALPFYPYYLSYYNPALGGSERAPATMMIGWGEGADQAGRYLDAKPDAAELTVASGYTNGPLSYFFRGRTLPLTFWHEADYAVVFAQDWQRQLPSRKSAAYFQTLPPEQVITLNGLEYAHIYDLRNAPLPAYVTDWTDADGKSLIRLATFQLPAAAITPGETVRAIFYLVNQAPITTNLNVLVRVVGQDGTEIARAEGWPWGAATSTWQRGVVWPDGHDLSIPAATPPGYYRVEVGFYDPATQALLAAVQPLTGAPLGDMVTVDVLQVGALPDNYAQPLDPPLVAGEQIALLGVDWATDAAALAPGDAIQPATPVTVTLTWQAEKWIATDYTAFVHLVGPDGRLVAQMDKPPLNGFLPTSTWFPGQRVREPFTLTLPADAAPGEYTLYTGFYDLATGARLPLRQGDTAHGDAFALGTLRVE